MEQKIEKLIFSMIPNSSHKLNWKDIMILDDNLGVGTPSEMRNQINRSDSNHNEPLLVRLMFSLILFCKHGRMDIRLNLEDYSLNENEILILVPGTIGEYSHLEEGSELGLVAFSDDAIRYAQTSLGNAMKNKLHYQPTKIKLRAKHMQRFISIYEQMREVLNDPDTQHKEEILDGYLRVMGSYTLQGMEEEQQTARKPSRKEDIFHKFLDLVHEHHQNERSVSYYADELCLSPKYLSRIVQEITGRHPTDWIRDYVILDAKTMLKSCEYTIQQISERLHFPNQSFFGKYFKKEVGCSPKDFR
jgi:AraC family transcriptional activator of pobA